MQACITAHVISIGSTLQRRCKEISSRCITAYTEFLTGGKAKHLNSIIATQLLQHNVRSTFIFNLLKNCALILPTDLEKLKLVVICVKY